MEEKTSYNGGNEMREIITKEDLETPSSPAPSLLPWKEQGGFLWIDGKVEMEPRKVAELHNATHPAPSPSSTVQEGNGFGDEALLPQSQDDASKQKRPRRAFVTPDSALDLGRLLGSLPPDAKNISCHDLKRICQNYNTIPCPNCYGGHQRPCQWCGDSGNVEFIPDADLPGVSPAPIKEPSEAGTHGLQNALHETLRYLPWYWDERQCILNLSDGVRLGFDAKTASRALEIERAHNRDMANLVEKLLSEHRDGSPASGASSPNPSSPPAREFVAAAKRIVVGKYIHWSNAGGVNDCKHGYGEGIPCEKCDLDTIKQFPSPSVQSVGLLDTDLGVKEA